MNVNRQFRMMPSMTHRNRASWILYSLRNNIRYVKFIALKTPNPCPLIYIPR